MSKRRGRNRNILYIGLDESNHGRYPEICVAVFSTILNDCRPSRLRLGKRDFSLMSKFQSPKRDYRFMIINKNQIPKKRNSLSIVAPNLIIPYLKEKETFDELRIFIDGNLKLKERRFLKRKLEDYASRILCRGFINYKKKIKKENKDRGLGKREKSRYYVQPFIIGLADLTANNFYTERSFRENILDPKIIDFKL